MLATARLRLAAMERAHLPALVRWLTDAAVVSGAVFGDPSPVSLEQQEEWLRRLPQDLNSRVLAVLALPEERLIGEVALQRIDWKNRLAHYAIIIGEPDARGSGYGTEATRLTLGYAFGGLGLHRVDALCLSENTAALRALERAGFRREGVRREAVWQDGAWRDLVVLGAVAGG